MQPTRNIALQFPVGGLNKKIAYQQQPPFTTPDCNNVRARGPIESRTRGGSRPGLSRTHGNILGPSIITPGVSADTYDSVTNKTTITADSAVMTSDMVGLTITFTAGSLSGESFVIDSVTSSTVFVVHGDADDAVASAPFNINTGDPINMLATVTPATVTDATVRDDFSQATDKEVGTLLTQWTAYAGIAGGVAPLLTVDSSGEFGPQSLDVYQGSIIPTGLSFYGAVNRAASGEISGAVLDLPTGITTTEDYSVTLGTIHDGRTPGVKHHIYMHLDNTTPAILTDGVVMTVEATAFLTVLGENYGVSERTVTVREYQGGVEQTPASVAITTEQALVAPVPVKLVIEDPNGTPVAKAYVGNVLVLTKSLQTSVSTKRRVGFAVESDATLWAAGSRTYVSDFRVDYNQTSSEKFKEILVAGAGGKIYRETLPGVMEISSTGLEIASDRLVQAVERGGLLYIADHSDVVHKGTDGTVGGAGNDELSAASISDWDIVPLQNHIADFVCVLSDPTSGTTAGTYKIATVTTGFIQLSPAPGAGAAGTTFRVERGPKIYDPVADTMTLWTATSGKGEVPTGCPLISRFKDRAVLGGNAVNARVWYMSRIADWLDFDYTSSPYDTAQAVAGTSTESGVVAQPMTAMFAHGDDYFVFAARDEMYMLLGDAGSGGSIETISDAIGVIGRAAYARGPSSETLFLSRDGIGLLPAGPSKPVSLSRESLPDDLLSVATDDTTILMQYDVIGRGVHLFITPDAKQAGTVHCWIDWEPQLQRIATTPDPAPLSFWPVSLQIRHDPFSVAIVQLSGTDDRAVVMGGRDGFLRKFDVDANTDDGTQISSHVLYGPFQLAGQEMEGILNDMTATLAAGSGPVTWDIMTGDNNEAAAKSTTALATGTWSTAGVNPRDRPRIRGVSCVLKLYNTSSAIKWAIENLTATLHRGGRQRLL